MFYVLASLETLAEEVENPFGTDINDLPLDTLTAVIKKDVYEILTNYSDKDYIEFRFSCINILSPLLPPLPR